MRGSIPKKTANPPSSGRSGEAPRGVRRGFGHSDERLGLDDVLPADARFPTVRAAVQGVSGIDVAGGAA